MRIIFNIILTKQKHSGNLYFENRVFYSDLKSAVHGKELARLKKSFYSEINISKIAEAWQ